MFAVIFEVQPNADRWDDYLTLAGQLRPELVQVPGFIDNERFRSLRTEGRLLSLSTWADEKAVIRWRSHGGHHAVQAKGRAVVLDDYHLRVGEITADTHVPPGMTLQQHRFDTTAIGDAKLVTISELDPVDAQPAASDTETLARRLAVPAVGQQGVVAVEGFGSITTEGKRLLLVSWRDADAVAGWPAPSGLPGDGRLRHRQVRVIRDYGLADRREAPQYHPPVARHRG